MKKIIKFAVVFIVISAIFILRDLWSDKESLQENLIRLHVVANSDSEEDQQIKLQVKDAITAYLQPILQSLPTKEDAMAYIRENIAALQELSNHVLQRLGVSDRAVVTLQPEAFSKRDYDTFSLPAGVYDSLRIEIGNAEGRNWWCVVFPTLCLPAAGSNMQDVAVSAGLSQRVTDTISNQKGYRVRFFLIDCLGRLENLFDK